MVTEVVAALMERQLDAWRALPPDAPEWNAVESYVDALRKLAAQKVAEREAGRKALREALDTLTAEFADDLNYFEIESGRWTADAVEWGEASAVAERVGALHAELRSRRELQNTPAAHYADAKRLRQQVASLEDTIYEHLDVLVRAFAGETSPAAPPVKPADVQEAKAVVREEPTAPPKEPAPAPSPRPSQVTSATPAPSSGRDIHRAIDAQHRRYSALTQAQEEHLLAAPPGAGIIYASSALGFEHLAETAGSLLADGASGMIPPNVAGEVEIVNWLAAFAKNHASAARLLAFQPVALPVPDLAARIEAALRYCAEGEAGRPMQVLFFLAPGGAGAWLAQPDASREALEERLAPVLRLRPWSEEAVAARLAEQGKSHDSGVIRSVLDCTGGWSWLLDKLFDAMGGAEDPAEAISTVEAGLAPGGELRAEFEYRTGVKPDTAQHRVLDLLLREGSVPVELVTPEMVGDGVSAEECAAAVRFLEALSCAEEEGDTVRANGFLARVLSTT